MVSSPSPNFWRGRRVLLTGSTGFKGGWLAIWLDRMGAKVTGLALPPPADGLFERARIATILDNHVVDIRNRAALAPVIAAARPEIVFHLAAQPLVRVSYQAPTETFATNVLGTVNVLDACRSVAGVKTIVAVTTDKVYHNAEHVLPYRESDRLGGHDPYSASKAACEIAIESYRASFLHALDIGVASARAGNVIGGGDWSEDRLVPDIVRSIQAGEQLVLRNPGAVRPWQHVLELCRGYLVLGERLLDDGEAALGAWNFGPSRENEVDVGTVVARTLKTWGGERIPPRVEPSPLKEAHYLKLDVSKAEAGLGWRPKLGFTETIDMTVDWYRDYSADPSKARVLTEAQIEAYLNLLP